MPPRVRREREREGEREREREKEKKTNNTTLARPLNRPSTVHCHASGRSKPTPQV